MENKHYSLPQLPYGYKDLEPYMSEEVLTLHHKKHHQAYVNGANAALEKLQEAREKNADVEMKAVLKTLSFNLAGHILHSVFWNTMAPQKEGKNKPQGEILKAIEEEFGSFERFKKEFSEAAASAEGSGWAALVCNNEKLLIMQIEKHNLNYYPNYRIILPLDVWEHAYYLDYKNERAKFIENWWNIVNWEEANKLYKG